MKAAVVILASREVQNFTRRIVYELDRQSNRPFLGSVLPSHVSIKQAFTFEDMTALESWFDSLTASLSPFEIALDRFYYTTFNGYGILGLNVVETPLLRSLHERVNRELAGVVIDPTANFDGESYRFHLTIEIGPVGEDNLYRAYFEQLENKTVQLGFTARELALFYYPDRQLGPDSFLVYKVLPISSLPFGSQPIDG